MNRSRDFRVWDKLHKEMLYRVHIFQTAFNSGKNHLIQDILYDYEEERYVFLENTGLHDKNKKEIYQGDIVEASFDDITYKKINSFKSEVKYGFGNFHVIDEKTDIFYPVFDIFAHVEVIGNIYENPELLVNKE
jgi:uncharacterized phage protein (TIGR01671 family)